MRSKPARSARPRAHRGRVRALPGTISLEGELFIFEIALALRLGKAQYDEVYEAIAAAISAAVSS